MVDSVQLPGCLLTKLKAVLSHEDPISVHSNKKILL